MLHITKVTVFLWKKNANVLFICNLSGCIYVEYIVHALQQCFYCILLDKVINREEI